MNRFVRLVGCLLLICILSTALGCESEYLGGDRDTKWKKDLNYMQKALAKKHVNLFFKTDEKKFNEEIASLKNSVENLNDDEIIAGIYKIVSSVGDSHTSAYKETSTVYPIEFYYFKEGIYVINTTKEYKKSLYAKLVKVNGKDIKELEKDIMPLIVDENEGMIKKNIPKYLSNPLILHGIKATKEQDKVLFTFEDKDGKTFSLNVNAVDKSGISKQFIVNKEYDESYPLYMQKNNLNYWYKYLEDKKILYFKYNKCQNDDKAEKPIEDFITQMLNFMNTHDVNKFVIDMRDNPGGSDKYINPIIEWLKGKKINDKNHLFVIVGRNTFSSAMIDAVLLKQKAKPTFVGEIPSSKPNHYGAVKSFELPNSKIEISYSTQFNKISDDNSNTFIPDKVIDISIKDYIQKKDPVLDYVISY